VYAMKKKYPKNKIIVSFRSIPLVHNSNDILMVEIKNGRKKIEDLQW
jgi:hypothetical protein